ncbi:MAG: pseudouridine synthase, partial [Ignavibacteriales bacterium]|nr:pseudouridine synthase [Ignavibacteriales bacterium]
MRYLLFNKPYLVLSQFTKVEGKKTLSDFGFPKNVYPVGRLDEESEGLLLLTDDATLKHQLEEPKFQHPRT